MSQIDSFQAALEYCHLEDLGFKGYPYTWNNNKPWDANTKVRLDRAVARKDWRDYPLSPYLFLLCVEGFTSLLAKVEMDRRVKGVSICRGAPTISNLMFANGSILFCQATTGEVKVINEGL